MLYVAPLSIGRLWRGEVVLRVNQLLQLLSRHCRVCGGFVFSFAVGVGANRGCGGFASSIFF